MVGLLGQIIQGIEEGVARTVTGIAPEAAIWVLALLVGGAEQGTVPFSCQDLPVEVEGGCCSALAGSFSAAVLVDDDGADGFDAVGDPEGVAYAELELSGGG